MYEIYHFVHTTDGNKIQSHNRQILRESCIGGGGLKINHLTVALPSISSFLCPFRIL